MTPAQIIRRALDLSRATRHEFTARTGISLARLSDYCYRAKSDDAGAEYKSPGGYLPPTPEGALRAIEVAVTMLDESREELVTLHKDSGGKGIKRR